MSHPLPFLTPPPKTLDLCPKIRSTRILVVEDDHGMMPLLSRALANLDPDIVLDWATNAEDARAAMRDGHYDAILADFMLADSDTGYSLYADSRELQPMAPFAMMTALPIAPPDGAWGLLSKPFDVTQCQAFLAELLDDVI